MTFLRLAFSNLLRHRTRSLLTLVGIAASVTVLTMVAVVPAAYAYARLNFPYRALSLGAFLAVNEEATLAQVTELIPRIEGDIKTNDEKIKQFDAAVALLKQQKPILGEYWSDYLKEIQAFQTGDSVIGTTWQVIVNAIDDIEVIEFKAGFALEGKRVDEAEMSRK